MALTSLMAAATLVATAMPTHHPSPATWVAAAWLNGSAGMIRRALTATELAGTAEAHVFASTIGFHELRWNGAVLGGGREKLYEPGVSVYGRRALYTSFNATALLAARGEANVFGALLGHGQSAVCGPSDSVAPCSDKVLDGNGVTLSNMCADVTAGGDASASGGCKAGKANGNAFRAVIALRKADGSWSHVLTGCSGWQVAESPMVYDDMYAPCSFCLHKDPCCCCLHKDRS